MFTARYELNLRITQVNFVSQELKYRTVQLIRISITKETGLV